MYSRPQRGRLLNFRISDKGWDWVDSIRRKHDVSRSDVIREALGVAKDHQPDLDRRLARLKQAREF